MTAAMIAAALTACVMEEPSVDLSFYLEKGKKGMINTMSIHVVDPVAERRLSVIGDADRSVVVTIGTPCPDPEGDWKCSFHVEGLDDSATRDAHGIDALDALLNAIAGARVVLDASSLALSWEGGEPGDTGIPRMVPRFYGWELARQLEEYIEGQVEAFANAVETRAEKQS